MFVRKVVLGSLLALFVPTVVLALGLGDIHLKSALNAVLDAEIDISSATPDELQELKATLAPRDNFSRYGLDYPAFLGTLSLQTIRTADGRSVIRVRSSDVVTEPFATLLVDVDWARGHLEREYTVLLDPPVFTDAAANEAVASPTTGGNVRSGAVERPSVAPTQSSAAPGDAPASGTRNAGSSGAARARPGNAAVADATPAASAGASASAAAGGSYQVRAGDTLSSIAASAYAGSVRSARERQLVAIYRGNLQAFAGNMNELRSGSRLTLPGDAELAAISPGEATAEVRRQYSTWRSGRPGAGGTAAAVSGGGQLRLVPPQEPAAHGSATGSGAGATGTGAAELNTAALQQRVQDLESQLAESKRLLETRNADLAALQARAARPEAPNVAAPAPAAQSAAATATPVAGAPASAPVTAPAPVAAPAPEAPQAPLAAAPAEPPPPAPAPATTPKPANAAPAAGSGLLDLLAEFWYIPAAVVAALIILLVLRALRTRQEYEFDRSLDRLGSTTLDTPNSALRNTNTNTVPLRTLSTPRAEQSFLVEESGTREQPAFSHLDSGATGEHVPIDDTVSSGAPVALDQGDPLAEADFHMAYGLYDQAADLVQIALSREPARRDLKLKLLEVFFVWGNKDRFLQSARELAGSRDQALAGEWEKTVIMGRQIAPEDPLFASSGSLQGAASAGVDLNLEGGQNRVDFDLFGEPTVGGRNDGIDLDLGAALGDGDPTGEAARIGAEGVDFVLDDPERGYDSTGSTREMPGTPGSTQAAPDTATVQIATGAESDVPTVEQPQLRESDNPTIREKLDVPTRIGMMSADQTAELALDDLGLDLGSLEQTDDSTGAGAGDQATLLTGLDDDTRQLLARAEAERGSADARGGVAPNTSGTWLFSDNDFAEAMRSQEKGSDAPTELVTMITPQLVEQPARADDSSPTSSLATLKTERLDLDLSDFGGELGDTGTGPGVGLDLDVGAPSVGEGTFIQTQRISADELELPDLEPATMSEVGTKLDLARAYMDMGDPDGARSILQEVLQEGSVSQKQEARRLIDALPG